ncbi:family 20 glycosylhydrolase [Neisseria dumasiana]|uniref:family 20 glycosylhydrolase n=1 Tax=Neisseria dumasiana TaxID=1931275 RepID=UPI000A18FCB4|nr:family 20 glycosylhydrolase [Neisseria dumasiana]OSI16599.1 molecular chaperone TorD [Neisseria dumasiana]
MKNKFYGLPDVLKTPSLYLLLGIISLTSWLLFAPAASNVFLAAGLQQHRSPKQSGLMLDTARRFYLVRTIKDFIDDLAESGGTFLHLHFSDHENYALESKLLGQSVQDAVRGADGTYINPNTGKPFLSFAQLRDITAYAAAKKIEIVPEVGSPNHMGGIFSLLEHKHGKAYTDALKSPRAADEININNPKSVALVKALIDEVAGAFGKNSRHFHIGGDEFGYSPESNHEFIRYANTLAEYLAKKRLTTRMWNDGLIKTTAGSLNRNIQITYWSYDGNPADRDTARKRRAIRMSMPELIEKGFSVLNYNSYYLYLVPQGHNFSHDIDFARNDIEKRWNLGVWDGENRENAVENTDKILGAALAIWGENSGKLDTDTIRKYAAKPLASVIRKTREADR